MRLSLGRDRPIAHAAQQFFAVDQPSPQDVSGELPVALPSGDALGENEVMNLETPRNRRAT